MRKRLPYYHLEALTPLIEGCKKQDPASQEKLYRQYYPALYAQCKTFFADPHDCLTALNNGMLKVYQQIHRFDSAKGSFFNWVYTIVRHSALDLIREKKNNLTFELTEDLQKTTEGNPFRELEWKDIYYYLDQLPPKTRCVCSLYYLEGFSIAEIAGGIDMKEGTVKWHLSECRQRLQTIFEQYNRKQIGG